MEIPPSDGMSQTCLSSAGALWSLRLHGFHFPLSVSYGHLPYMWRRLAEMHFLRADRGRVVGSNHSIQGNRISPLSAPMGNHRTSLPRKTRAGIHASSIHQTIEPK